MDAFLSWITQRALTDLDPTTEAVEDWNYALITLMFRFVAVFVVLWFIQAGMQLAARIIRRMEASEAGRAATPAPAAAAPAQAADADAGLDAATAAAIGIALELDSQPEAVRVEEQRSQSAWSMAGRANQLRNR